jgi:hypothetical protein
MRVFPDIPVCVKGNETRMGKGKGSFEYWACRVPLGRVVFEVGGGGIREEIAKQGMSERVGFGVGVDVDIDFVLNGQRRIELINSIKTCSNEITSPNGIHNPQHPIPPRNTLNNIIRSTLSRSTSPSTIGGIGR